MDSDTWVQKKRTSATLLPVLVFVLTLFLFGPARIYIGNFKEFSFLFYQSVVFFLVVSLLLTAILLSAVLFFARRLQTQRLIVSILVAAAFLTWLQGNFILWRYGVLNGREIEWETLIRYGIVDSLVWVGVMVVAVLKAGLVFRISRLASLALIVVQLLSVAYLWLSMPKDQSFRRQPDTSDTLFLFSRHVNVIILVLDTFQSDLFQDLVRENPDLRESFNGFTYFRNSLAGSDGTSVSIPNMLTARNYDNSIPYLDFVKQSFLENSLPKTLVEHGFDVDLDPIVPYSVYTDFSGIPLSSKRLFDRGAFLKEQAFLTDLSLFRSLPHFLKELVYNHQKWFLSGFVGRFQEAKEIDRAPVGNSRGSSSVRVGKYAKEFDNLRGLVGKVRDAGFLRRLVPSAGVLEGRDTFKFYHLNGVHLQFMMNEQLQYEQQLPSRAAMKRQGTGALKIAAILLERLKGIGAFDGSLIFIVGDHGSGMSFASINPSPAGDAFNKTGPYRGFFRNFKTAGIPLILVKRIGSHGPLRVSDAPVALGDIPQTVVEELRLKARFPGRSMFRVKAGEDRERIYRAFLGSQEDVDYLAPLYEYSVNGFSWDDASWKETGNIYYPKSK